MEVGRKLLKEQRKGKEGRMARNRRGSLSIEVNG